MSKLSGVTNQQLNPVDADRFHIIHQIAGVWGSFYITFATIKAAILSGVLTMKVTKEPFVFAEVGDYFSYIPDRYESVEKIILKGGASNISLEIKDYFSTVVYPMTEGLVHPSLNFYDENPTGAQRALRLYPTGSCTIVIISNTNI